MDLEAEYNNTAKVPEYEAIVERWTRDAAAFRDGHDNAELGLVYGPSPRQLIDLFWPGATRSAPVALFIHGGYWQWMDNSVFSHFARGLVAHGIAVALPMYDLCPAVTMAALVEELRAAAAFLHRRTGRKPLALGHSAGGHLAAMLLATDWAARGLPAGMVPAALPISGLFDLAPLLQTSIAGGLGLDEAEARRLSPLLLPQPPGRIHAVVGGEEGAEYTRQSRSIAAAWGGSWESLAGHNHFTVAGELADPNSHLVAAALRLAGAVPG